MKARLLGAVCAFIISLTVNTANADKIDFNEFPFGTNLNVINASVPGEFTSSDLIDTVTVYDAALINDMTLLAPVDLADLDIVFY